jgi:hypothetical protein
MYPLSSVSGRTTGAFLSGLEPIAVLGLIGRKVDGSGDGNDDEAIKADSNRASRTDLDQVKQGTEGSGAVRTYCHYLHWPSVESADSRTFVRVFDRRRSAMWACGRCSQPRPTLEPLEGALDLNKRGIWRHALAGLLVGSGIPCLGRSPTPITGVSTPGLCPSLNLPPTDSDRANVRLIS